MKLKKKILLTLIFIMLVNTVSVFAYNNDTKTQVVDGVATTILKDNAGVAIWTQGEHTAYQFDLLAGRYGY